MGGLPLSSWSAEGIGLRDFAESRERRCAGRVTGLTRPMPTTLSTDARRQLIPEPDLIALEPGATSVGVYDVGKTALV
jgi:hypothetical protein